MVKVSLSTGVQYMYNWLTMLALPVDKNTASAPRGPNTRSATKPTFSPSYAATTLAMPSAKPGRLAKEVPGAGEYSPLLSAVRLVRKYALTEPEMVMGDASLSSCACV